MAVPITIHGMTGNGGHKTVPICPDSGALLVTTVLAPPGVECRTFPFRQYFTDDGLSTGSTDMRVDGSRRGSN